MKTYKSGTQVQYGIYISPKALDFRFVGADNETLEGKSGAQYYRLPTLIAILSAPALGGLFVMTFPVIVVIMVALAIVKAITSAVSSLVQERAHLVNMQWQPSAAYLNKKRRAGKSESAQKNSAELQKLEKEVADRKQEE
ncbi:MAG TPA: hypothetical protein DCS07_06095 [Bdellovibrionales bacterium]|nr:MAG: hypothetical protein A2Z97_13120 [Bdellovibrionales bacterium GWB1_52_6]OFZ05773.1 MAG: hypothetical protein A2X97_03670 [Bdellovibrionales bacterium GWA1_52_35]OFZ43697.1 MAG: hypothetical protein A2070_02745 [Bdellovibrionales bacterium GWC1_52_8]HAR42188.1 hypothetical protein [Bdellovibrionales bacterium]HCM40286.1 hypothetical protein [Bdellovibrionales bacterium]